MQWTLPGESRPQKARIERTTVKCMLVVFLDRRGVVYHEFVPNGVGIGGRVYLGILERFWISIRRCRRDLFTGRITWGFQQDGAPAHKTRDVLRWFRDKDILLMPTLDTVPTSMHRITGSSTD